MAILVVVNITPIQELWLTETLGDGFSLTINRCILDTAVPLGFNWSIMKYNYPLLPDIRFSCEEYYNLFLLRWG